MSTAGRIGSLQAAQAIGASIKTLLGPSSSLKCCIGDDNDDAIICSSAFKILQYLDVKHPTWFVINDSCEAMYKTYGSGCKTLLCMTGYWSREAEALQSQGIPIPVITRLFDEALNESITVLKELAIPLQEIKEYHWETLNIESTSHQREDISNKQYKACEESEKRDTSSVAIGNDKLSINSVTSLAHQNYKKGRDIEEKYDKYQSTVNHCEWEKDEFDDCFDDSESSSSCNLPSSSRAPSLPTRQTSSQRHYTTSLSNKSVLKRTDEMLHNLSLLGLGTKSTKTKINFSKISFTSRNLLPNTPKTEVNDVTNGPPNKHFTSKINDFDIINKKDVKMLGDLLAHGKQREMDLAVDVIFAQVNLTKSELCKFEVDKNCIHTEIVCGPQSDHSQVINGILLKTTSQLKHLPRNDVNIALVNGDITNEFRHAGYKDSFHVKQVFQEGSFQDMSVGSNQSWLCKVSKVLTDYNIGALVCRGNIDKSLEELCQSLGILTVCCVSPKVLKLLSSSLGASITVYLTDLRESGIGRPVCIHQWLLPGQKTLERDSYIVITTNEGKHETLILTVFLSSPTENLLMESELAFWSCISRLKNTISQGCVLPGGGLTELECIRRLRLLAGKKDLQETRSSSWIKRSLSSYRETVYSAFADGLQEFVATLILNTGTMLHHGQALTKVDNLLHEEKLHLSSDDTDQRSTLLMADDFLAKLYAWQRAIGIVCLLIQSDMIVETGVKKDQ